MIGWNKHGYHIKEIASIKLIIIILPIIKDYIYYSFKARYICELVVEKLNCYPLSIDWMLPNMFIIANFFDTKLRNDIP